MQIRQSNAIGISLIIIWASIILAGIFAPVMITGSEQEHLPMVAFTEWIWGIFSTGLVGCLLFVDKKHQEKSIWKGLLSAVSTIWIGLLLIIVLTPNFITGTDPTQIPLAGIIAPAVGTVVTAFACILTAIKVQNN